MAILEKFQGNGFGNIILDYGEQFMKNKKANITWCNAREIAVNFYQKNGYKIIGDAFDIKDIGIHYTMYKVLNGKNKLNQQKKPCFQGFF